MSKAEEKEEEGRRRRRGADAFVKI